MVYDKISCQIRTLYILLPYCMYHRVPGCKPPNKEIYRNKLYGGFCRDEIKKIDAAECNLIKLLVVQMCI